jgi:long-chain acyl-CoA synthetase
VPAENCGREALPLEKRLETLLLERLREEPNARCLFWRGNWMTRDDLARLVLADEAALAAAGFGPGARLASLLPNSPSTLALSIACWRLGGAIAPLNPRAGSEGLSRILDRLEPFATLVPPGAGELGAALASRGFRVAEASLDGSLGALERAEMPVEETPDGETAVLFATAGTTGFPKLVPISHGNLIENVTRCLTRLTFLRPDDVFLNVLPCFHTLGYTAGGMIPLLGRMGQALLPTVIPTETTLGCVAEAGVTVLVAVPTLVGLLVGAAARGVPMPRGIRAVVSGGDRLNPALDGRSRKAFGVPILEGYGLTECSPVVAVNPSYEGRRFGTVGPILEGYEWEIRDLEGRRIEGREGVLWVRGPSVARGYFRDPENTAARFRDGWFDTGDVVRIDEEGYLSILDRAGDLIIVGGFNVYPQEVEQVLLEHPGVAGAAVVGESNPTTGEIVKAFVIPRDRERPVAPRELVSWCKERLPHFKVPRKVLLVEEFPLSSVGKVLRRKLRERNPEP